MIVKYYCNIAKYLSLGVDFGSNLNGPDKGDLRCRHASTP